MLHQNCFIDSEDEVISRPSHDPRPDDAIRDAQRGGAGRGGAA
jgi:hypothetical protein